MKRIIVHCDNCQKLCTQHYFDKEQKQYCAKCFSNKIFENIIQKTTKAK